MDQLVLTLTQWTWEAIVRCNSSIIYLEVGLHITNCRHFGCFQLPLFLNDLPPAQSVDLHLLAPGAGNGPTVLREPTASAAALGLGNQLLSDQALH